MTLCGVHKESNFFLFTAADAVFQDVAKNGKLITACKNLLERAGSCEAS
jgi:hypothetical protein